MYKMTAIWLSRFPRSLGSCSCFQQKEITKFERVSISTSVYVVCGAMRRECVGRVSTKALADVLADASVGLDSLLLP